MADYEEEDSLEEDLVFDEELDSRRPVLLKGPKLRDRLQGKTFLIPSFITVVGIFCGFLAAISATRGEFVYACKCIALAILLDGLDGRVARKLNATSAFGREFDSLSDVVAFGVAPAILVYSWGFNRVADEFGLLIAFVFLVCGATRLARFNITSTGELVLRKSAGSGFQGLPIPGAAAAIASIVYCFPAPIEAE
ncbi:MAG: CDP-diacylglycerol--serine O-phosphatidyltransferase, partial [Bdellovibrionales bacterium]|nr:CDP-diacylglycerol--serine O-phosphatidyltransferase [Bdellovibrionales bacterium]